MQPEGTKSVLYYKDKTRIAFSSLLNSGDERTMLDEAVRRERKFKEKCRNIRFATVICPELTDALRLEMSSISFCIADAETVEMKGEYVSGYPIR